MRGRRSGADDTHGADSYGNESQGANIFDHKENEKTDEWKRKELHIKEWRAEIPRVVGHSYISPFEMYGLLAVGNMEYRQRR